MKFTPRDFGCWAIQDWVAVSGNGILTAYCKIAWWRGKRKSESQGEQARESQCLNSHEYIHDSEGLMPQASDISG